MSNLETVERIILGRTATAAAKELHDQGLLMPDLPEPYPYSGEVPCWYEGSFRAGISSAFGGRKPNVTFASLEPGGVVHMDSESARELALMLLAAANYAETEKLGEQST